MDWLGSVLGIAGVLTAIKDIRIATSIWLISNIAFLIWGIISYAPSIAIMNFIYLSINIATIVIIWRKP